MSARRFQAAWKALTPEEREWLRTLPIEEATTAFMLFYEFPGARLVVERASMR